MGRAVGGDLGKVPIIGGVIASNFRARDVQKTEYRLNIAISRVRSGLLYGRICHVSRHTSIHLRQIRNALLASPLARYFTHAHFSTVAVFVD